MEHNLAQRPVRREDWRAESDRERSGSPSRSLWRRISLAERCNSGRRRPFGGRLLSPHPLLAPDRSRRILRPFAVHARARCASHRIR